MGISCYRGENNISLVRNIHSLVFFLPLEHKIHIYIAIRYFKTLTNFGENIPVISLPE